MAAYLSEGGGCGLLLRYNHAARRKLAEVVSLLRREVRMCDAPLLLVRVQLVHHVLRPADAGFIGGGRGCGGCSGGSCQRGRINNGRGGCCGGWRCRRSCRGANAFFHLVSLKNRDYALCFGLLVGVCEKFANRFAAECIKIFEPVKKPLIGVELFPVWNLTLELVEVAIGHSLLGDLLDLLDLLDRSADLAFELRDAH